MGNEHSFRLRERLPRHSRLPLLNRAILQVDQHLDAVVIGFFEQTVGRADEEAAVGRLLEARQEVEILDVKRHRHEIVRTESAQRKGVLAQRLHVTTNWLAEKTECAETRKEGEQRYDEGRGRR